MASNAPASRQFTWADFVALDDDDPRELIDGELVDVEAPTKLHEHIVITLGAFLKMWTMKRRAGVVLGSGYKLRISEGRGIMPDLQFFSTEQAKKLPDQAMTEGHPDLVVEVLSESSRRYDRVTKLGWYAAIGVPEYWIVDPTSQTLERLVLADGQYVIAEALEGDATFAPPSFDGLEVPMRELWEMPTEDAPEGG